MCRYYAHAFTCKHISLTFACFCDPAALIQTPCGERHIWQTITLNELCEECKEFFHGADQQQQQQHRVGRVRRGRS